MGKLFDLLKDHGLVDSQCELSKCIEERMTAEKYIEKCIKAEVGQYIEEEFDPYAEVPDNFIGNFNGVTIRTNKYASKVINGGADVNILSRAEYATVINSGDKATIMSTDGTIVNSGDECIIGGLNVKDIVDSGMKTQIVSTRDFASIVTNGYNPRIISTGESTNIICNSHVAYVNSEGRYANIVCNGYACTVKAKLGSTITLSECRSTKNGEIHHRRTEKVDGVKIKADKWYQLRGNEFVETIPGENDEVCPEYSSDNG